MGNRVPKTRGEELEERFAKPAAETNDIPLAPGETDYTDPEVQDRILNPPTIAYTLNFEDGRPDKPIAIRTAFTPNMVNRRLVLDQLYRISSLVFAELQTYTPDKKMPSAQWINENMAYVGAAACLPKVCEHARDVIAILSDTPRQEIEDGISSMALGSLTIALMTIYQNHVKNSPRGKTVPANA